jgi:hypothetical protein
MQTLFCDAAVAESPVIGICNSIHDKKTIISIILLEIMVLREFYTNYFLCVKKIKLFILTFLFCIHYTSLQREREAILSLYNIDSITVSDRSKYLLLVFQIPLSPSAKVCICKKYEHSVRRKAENNISI